MVEADKHNALAEKRNIQAFEKHVNAEIKVNKQEKRTTNAIEKLRNRKRGIMKTSISTFIEVHKKIMQIEFNQGDGIRELVMNMSTPIDSSYINSWFDLDRKELNTEQMLSAYFIKGGISGVIAKEAEMNARLASIRNRQADVALAQAETICVALESIEVRVNKISDLLAKLNVILIKTIDTTSAIISEKGIDKQKYTKQDKEKLMTCINAATTVKKIIDTPILDMEGNITQELIKAIQHGNSFLEEINNKMKI